MCRVTVQCCSAAAAPKLRGTEKLLLCHRLTPRRSFFPDWQRVDVPSCSLGLRFRLRWAQRGIRFQCCHIFLFARSGEFRWSTCIAADIVTYVSASRHMTVTSQHKDLPFCHGTSVIPPGLFPSVRNNPAGFFVTGVPTGAMHRATNSFTA